MLTNWPLMIRNRRRNVLVHQIKTISVAATPKKYGFTMARILVNPLYGLTKPIHCDRKQLN